MKKKKPDNVAWDEEKQAYISKLLPYANSLSGPIIDVPNVDHFKKKGVELVDLYKPEPWKDIDLLIIYFVPLIL